MSIKSGPAYTQISIKYNNSLLIKPTSMKARITSIF